MDNLHNLHKSIIVQKQIMDTAYLKYSKQRIIYDNLVDSYNLQSRLEKEQELRTKMGQGKTAKSVNKTISLNSLSKAIQKMPIELQEKFLKSLNIA